jgi:perosamine synthetase
MSEKRKDIVAVVMAGGRGVRMRPLTDSTPKPLLPVGTKPILEVVICKLRDEGFKKIIITTGYKGRMIESYFGDGSRYGVEITYTKETKPLGTVGALTLIPWNIKEPFLVINGDILTDQNLADFMKYHVEAGTLITVGIMRYQEKIRFGVVDRDGSILKAIEEKPELYFDIGAGIYAISPEVIEQIPPNTFFNFPDLIKKIHKHEKVGCFEVKGFWRDIGREKDFEEVNQDVELLESLGCYKRPSSEEKLPPKVKIPIASPSLSYEEARACFNVVLSNWVNEGERVTAFENSVKDYIGCDHAVAFFNGTVALHSLLSALGIGPGDEVIVPSLTFVSTATTVVHVGGRPVFADIDPHTFNMDPEDAESRITEKTKAIVVVHYAGQSADMDRFVYMAKKYGLFLIEDAAEALGAEYNKTKVGSFGIAGMFSFTPTKNITTGEGGIITTNNRELAEKLRLLKNHGCSEPYHHIMVGYNYRMTEMQGAVGVEQIKKLPAILERKTGLADYFSKRLREVQGITPPTIGEGRNHTYMLYTVKIDPEKCPVSRDVIIEHLQDRGIQARVCFPPLHTQPIFKGRFDPPCPLPVTEEVAGMMLSLPIYSQLEYSQIDYIVESLKTIVGFAERTKR